LLLSIATFTLVSAALKVMLDAASCMINSCGDDGLNYTFSPIVVGVHMLVSGGVVFPTMLGGSRIVGVTTSIFVVSVTFAVIFGYIFYVPETGDSLFYNIVFFIRWLGLSWFIAGLVSFYVWRKVSENDT